MKKHLLLPTLLIISLISFFQVSCSKDDDQEIDQELVNDKPGKIPGLGDQEGELTGKVFQLPEGISVEGEIIGHGGDYSANSNTREIIKAHSRVNGKLLASSPKAEIATDLTQISRGSGIYVRLAIKLKNSTGANKTIELPAGLILKSVSGTYQNGVLIKKTSVTIPANKTILLDLSMYCGNSSKSASSSSEKYVFSVVTNSAPVQDLINRLKNKKINIEQFAKTDDAIEIYDTQISIIQSLLWQITDGEEGLTEYDYETIDNIPND